MPMLCVDPGSPMYVALHHPSYRPESTGVAATASLQKEGLNTAATLPN